MAAASRSRVPESAYLAARAFARSHPFWSFLIAIALLYGGYEAYVAITAAPSQTLYVTARVATSTVVASMTETGQVSASDELPLTPKASGQVTAVYVTPGEQVIAGQAVAQLDATDALQTLHNAELSLKNEQLSYEQATASSTLSLNLLTAQNGVTNAQTALQKTHDASYASLSNIYSDLSTVQNDLDHSLNDQNVPGRTTQDNVDAFADTVSQYDNSIGIYKNAAQTSYTAAVAAYNTAASSYKATALTATNDELVSLAQTTYTATQAMAEAVKNVHDFFDRVNNDYTTYNLKSSTVLNALLTTTASDATTMSNDLATALTIQSNIVSAEQSLAQAQNTLQVTQGGSNALTVQQAQLALEQAEQAVTNAQQTVADYTVTAPFSGTIASVDVKRFDEAALGTAVATLVSRQQTVDISVNEVDAAKLKTGQKATLTFDALPSVTIAGTVSAVDTLGSANQGVVSYDAIITFDTPNAKVLPGMSATAEIVTGTETGLTVPSSAIKTSGSQSYVEVFKTPLAGSETAPGVPSATPPERVFVRTGLTDDTNTIVEQGLVAGEEVVTETTTSAAAVPSAAANATSRFGGNGSFRGGGAFRAIGG